MEGAAEAPEGRRRDHRRALLRPPRGNALLPGVCIFFALLRFAFTPHGKYSVLSTSVIEHDFCYYLSFHNHYAAYVSIY